MKKTEKFFNAFVQYKENTLLELYTDREDCFSVGMIELQNDTEILLKAIDEQGKEAGYYVVKKSSIQNILYDTEYLRKISLYMECWTEHFYKKWSSFEKSLFKKEDNIFKQAISYLQKAGRIVTVDGSFEHMHTGYIEEISCDFVKIKCIDISSAAVMEEVQVDLEDIDFLELESIDNYLLQYAYEKGGCLIE